MPKMQNYYLPLTVLLLLVSAQAQVCVRSISLYEDPAAVQVAVTKLQQKGLQAYPCGQARAPLELWVYPMTISMESAYTSFYVQTIKVPGGVVGQYATYTPRYTAEVWVVALHPNGGVPAIQRYTGYGLNSQAGRMAKWIKKRK